MEPEPVAADASLPPSAVSTRRVFLMAGVTFVLGATAGGWLGYSGGVAVAAATADEADNEPAPTGNSDLDELRRLAVKAPIEELLAMRLVFVNCLFREYPNDRILWRGAKRIAQALVDGHDIPDRRLFAIALAQVIEQNDPEFTAPLKEFAPRLRRLK
jgi:hypothetical protein